MSTPENASVLRCNNMIASDRGIAETQGKQLVTLVPAAEITRIELRHGRSAHRPLVSLLLGIALLLVGAFGLYDLIVHPAGFRYESAMIAFGILGGSFIFDVMKLRYYLDVHRPKETSKLVFTKNADRKDILTFCEQLRLLFKCEITDKTE